MTGTPIFPGIYYCFGYENKIPCRPFGAGIIVLFFRGLHPPLRPVGLSGLTLKFLCHKFIHYLLQQKGGKKR